MLKFKVVLIKRQNEGIICYLYDSKTVLRGGSKYKILRRAQKEIVREVDRRGLFSPRFKESTKFILEERGYIAKKGDTVEQEMIGVEFGYNYVRFESIELYWITLYIYITVLKKKVN